jgi:tRNA dimethylallyltransferase
VIAVFGPTGVGKTAVGVAVAEYFGVRVVSCDSMQLYRGFPVLTNQPSSAEHEKAPHALVGVLEPEEEWSAARYAQAAATLIDEDVGRRGVAVLVGGTGLYLRAALAPLAMRTPGDPLLRAELETRAKRDGGHGLHGELASLDPEAAASIHPHNVRRTIRALEAVLAHGPGSWSGRQDLWRPDFRHPTLVVGLRAERELLYERINRRTQEMLTGGAVDEVRSYLATQAGTKTEKQSAGGLAAPAGGEGHEAAAGVPVPDGRHGAAAAATEGDGRHRAADTDGPRGIRRAIGFREIEAHLRGEITADEAAAAMAAATRAYARRQLTWMRRLPGAVIIDTSWREPGGIAQEIIDMCEGGGGVQQVGRPG